ncbi:DnaD domain protein [Xylanibacillus composti]|nr:DnaD domain protein [Xylanibacillus composti]
MGAAFHEGVALAYGDGVVNVPYSLLRYYHKLGLGETEMMLLLQLLAFKEKELNAFPTPDELSERMGLPLDAIAGTLGRLVKQGWLFIEEKIDPASGVQSECYSLTPLYRRLAETLLAEQEQHAAVDMDLPAPETFGQRQSAASISMEATDAASASAAVAEKDVYFIFEKEFARPLTPMEGETIAGWLDADGYPRELVLLALKEAVFAGKLNFRYIDRILLEWQRNRIRTAEQAKEFTKQFRSGR